MQDLLGSFDSLEEALLNINDERNRYFQVVERTSMQVVKEGWAMFKFYDPRALDLEDPGNQHAAQALRMAERAAACAAAPPPCWAGASVLSRWECSS